MKRWILLAGIVLLGIASVIVSERQKVDVPASPAALLYLVADTEQELTRMPVHFARMSDAEEIRIGEELARSYSGMEGRENTPENTIVEHYITRVGTELARHGHRILPYKFHYIPDSNFINAFALPGGHVYVGGGLVALMDSEDELAAVIGHEIEHIDHYHCSDRVQQEQALRRIPLGGLVAIPIEVFEAGYSKDQELEADREGTRLAVQTGYSANGAIRMFETFARLQKEYQATAKTPQEEVSQVAQQALEGYFRSHPLPSERIAQIQRMIATEGWSPRAERDLRIAYLFVTAKAQRALDARKYAQAEQLANQSLRLRPDQPRAFQVLAAAQFAQADFSGAAAAYRKILEAGWPLPEIVNAYALTLAAADRKSAASEFRRWAEDVKREKPREVDVAGAGLALVAGDREAAHRLEIDLKVSGDVQAPVWIGELGWWHYLNGDYQQAVELSSEARQQRPADVNLGTQLAWALIETRHYGDALQTVESFSYERQPPPEKVIVQAVAHWQAQERDEAMRDFDIAMGTLPEWENPKWVNALYSPLVAQSVQEMQTERERRRQKARAATASHDAERN
jgi:Zn-dependent protease with chaperone function/Tfp pilus assembly protein PilF